MKSARLQLIACKDVDDGEGVRGWVRWAAAATAYWVLQNCEHIFRVLRMCLCARATALLSESLALART